MVRQKKKKDAPRTGTFQTQQNPAQLANQLIAEGGTKSRRFQELDKQTKQPASKVVTPTSQQPTSQLRPEELAKTGIQNRTTLTPEQLEKSRPQEGILSPVTKALGIDSLGIGHVAAALGLSALPSALSGIGAALGIGGTATTAATSGSIGSLTSTTLSATEKSGIAKTVAVNTATTAATTSMITGFAASAANPALIASMTVGALGSYPFAGFIKEEALQTISFAVKNAIEIGDDALFAEAVAFQEELLSRDLQNNIMGAVPYANVLQSLDDFYEAARIKLAVDKKLFAYRKEQIATGQTDAQMYAAARQEQFEMDKAVIDHFNEQRIVTDALIRDAENADMKADAAFWRKERDKQRKKEEEDRQAVADFWLAFHKERAKIQEDSRPSKLNFGLL